MNIKSFVNKVIIFVLFLACIYVIANQLIFKSERVSSIETEATSFTLKDLHGKEYRLEDYKNKGVIVNFWATYCPPCEREFPTLESAYQQYKDQSIEILAINVNEPWRFVDSFIRKRNISFPVLLDRHGDIAKSYNVINLPITFFINSEGEVVSKVSGEITEEIIHDNVKYLD